MICAWIDTSSDAVGSSSTRKRPQRQRARNAHALLLPPRQLVRVAQRPARGSAPPWPSARPPRPRCPGPARQRARAARRARCSAGRSTSTGSWNTICMRRRSRRSSAADSVARSVPSNSTWPLWPAAAAAPAGQRGLAAARLAHHAGDAAAGHVQVDVGHRRHRARAAEQAPAAAEAACQAAHLDQGVGASAMALAQRESGRPRGRCRAPMSSCSSGTIGLHSGLRHARSAGGSGSLRRGRRRRAPRRECP
jgi:hypothetical protein